MQTVSLAGGGIVPVACKFVGAGDALVVDTWGTAAPAPLAINARVMLPDGQIQTHSWQHTPNVDRTRQTTRHPLGECILLAVLVDTVGIAYARGQCWVSVALQRGVTGVGLVHEQLIADYVTGRHRPEWPDGGPLSSVDGPGVFADITGANPAAGAEIADTVPSGARWRLVGMRFSLVTGIAAPVRWVRLIIDDGATPLYVIEPAGSQAASLTVTYQYGTGFPVRNGPYSDQMLPLPLNLSLMSGWRIRTSTVSLDAGDNFGAPQLTVEQWIEV